MINLQRRKDSFDRQFWRLPSVMGWPYCFGLGMSQNIMVGVHGGATSLSERRRGWEGASFPQSPWRACPSDCRELSLDPLSQRFQYFPVLPPWGPNLYLMNLKWTFKSQTKVSCSTFFCITKLCEKNPLVVSSLVSSFVIL